METERGQPRLYVAILAGGSGTRLWPLSRAERPKQLLPLAGDRTLIQQTLDRVLPLVPPERVLVLTERSHADAIREQLPELPAPNIVVEPPRRGTASPTSVFQGTACTMRPSRARTPARRPGTPGRKP